MEIHVKEKVLHVHVTYGMRHENINQSVLTQKGPCPFSFFHEFMHSFRLKMDGKNAFLFKLSPSIHFFNF